MKPVVKRARPLTPHTYLREILSSSLKHGGESLLAAVAVGMAGASALLMRSVLNLPALRGTQILLIMLPALGAALMFVASMAAWRLHRRQEIALATTRSLLDLNAGDRVILARDLAVRHRRNEHVIELQHATLIEKLSAEIAVLRADAAKPSRH